MLLSGGRLDSSGIGIRHYTPNSSMRQSAVFADILEYSYKFKTDKMDSESHTIFNKKNNLIAITGDSFTEGQVQIHRGRKASKDVFVNKAINPLM